MCLRNLGMVWGNYLIIEVAGIPLHIGEHPEHFGCNICQLIYNQSSVRHNRLKTSHPLLILYVRDLPNRVKFCHT